MKLQERLEKETHLMIYITQPTSFLIFVIKQLNKSEKYLKPEGSESRESGIATSSYTRAGRETG